MDFLSEWRQWNPAKCPHLLEADAVVLASIRSAQSVVTYRTWGDAMKAPDFCEPGANRLHLGLLPAPFIGDLLNASIY